MPPSAQILNTYQKLQQTRFVDSIDNNDEDNLSDEEKGAEIKGKKLVKLTERAIVATESKAIQDIVQGVQQAAKKVKPKSLI